MLWLIFYLLRILRNPLLIDSKVKTNSIHHLYLFCTYFVLWLIFYLLRTLRNPVFLDTVDNLHKVCLGKDPKHVTWLE